MQEELQQHRPVHGKGHDVRTRHAALTGLQCRRQVDAQRQRQVVAGQQRPGPRLRDLGLDAAVVTVHTGYLGQEHQLVGVQCHGRGRCHLFHGQVEGLTRGRVTDVGQQHDLLIVQRPLDGHGIHLAHHTAVDMVHPVHDAHRPGQCEIARHHPDPGIGHRRVGQPLREPRLHVVADRAGRFLRAFQCHRVGDAQTVVVLRCLPAKPQLLVDLWPAAIDDHDVDADRVKQAQILDQRIERTAGGRHLARNAHHEGLPPELVDVGRHLSQPVHELPVLFGLPFGGRQAGGGNGGKGHRISHRNTARGSPSYPSCSGAQSRGIPHVRDAARPAVPVPCLL